ncbi:hypothetical protein [Phaeobacter sp.]|uniref:hypothetical protein n=1 Tax=Phaeobacter sp. TaxID=1902409 RepID=UPI0025E3E0F6|nr:hypothetical protein [Phaeobacter sp.]
MFGRIAGAAARGILMALLIALPSLLLPLSATRSPEIIALIAILAAALTFVEYFSSYPSFMEFRDAPPLNRLRFMTLVAIVALLSLLARHPLDPTTLTALITIAALGLGDIMHFAFSPVELVALMMPPHFDPEVGARLVAGASLAYLLSLFAILAVMAAIRWQNWPLAHGPFNVWTNLPLFDPTTGGDVLDRLQRDARINIVAGVLLPFALPAAAKLMSGFLDLHLLSSPQTFAWVLALWAFVPASMVMRGVAMLRICSLIAQRRKAAYASAETLQAA